MPQAEEEEEEEEGKVAGAGDNNAEENGSEGRERETTPQKWLHSPDRLAQQSTFHEEMKEFLSSARAANAAATTFLQSCAIRGSGDTEHF